MSRSVRAPLAWLVSATLLGGCLAPLAAPPASLPEPTSAPPARPVAPVPAPSQSPEMPAIPVSPVACEVELIDSLAEAIEAGEGYAYQANGWNEFNTGGRRNNSRHRAELAFEGARAGQLGWWRRVSGGLELHDEAVGNAGGTWLRQPLWRSWQEDRRGKVDVPDPLADLLAVEGWDAREIDEGCLLWAVESGRRAARDYTLLVGEFGEPLSATSAGMRPAAPVGEGVPAAWWIEYEFTAEMPALPAVPPATLAADDETALAMLAANDAPGSRIIWRDATVLDEVLAFSGPEAYGFVAWGADGALTEAAIIDQPGVAADLLEFYRLGDWSDDSDDVLYLIALVLDERVAELSLKVDGQPSERLSLAAPGGLIGPLPDYLDDWRFFYEDGERVPLPGKSGR